MRRLLVVLALSLSFAAGLAPSLAHAAEDSSLTVGATSATQSTLTTQEGLGRVLVVDGPTFYETPQTITFRGRLGSAFTGYVENRARFSLYKGDELIDGETVTYTGNEWDQGKYMEWSYTVTELGTYTVYYRNLDSRAADQTVYEATFTVAKAEPLDNPMIAKAKTVSFGATTVKKKAQSVAADKAFSVSNAQGDVTFKATKSITKNAMKKITVAKNGKVTVKKGTKAGTYKLKVKITAAGNDDYKAKSNTVTLAVKVLKSAKKTVKSHKPAFDAYCDSTDTKAYAKLTDLDALARLGGKVQIYRATSKNGTYKLVTTTTKTEYVDKATKKNKTYWYKIRIVAKEGKNTYTSKFSEPLSVKVAISPVAVPENVTIQNTPIGVEIRWKRLSSYTMKGVRFFVGRSETAGSTNMILEGGSTWYDDEIYFYDETAESGKTYYYTVYASSTTLNWTVSAERVMFRVP